LIVPECGRDNVANGMNLCPDCGAKIPEETKPSSRIIVTQKIGEAEGTVTGIDMRNQFINYFSGESEAQNQRNKLKLLDKVKKFWIEGVFEKSVHGAVLIELGKETQLGAIERPWDVLIQTSDQPDQSLPADKKIVDVFNEMGRSLLILGMPGAGKTTTLLELARDKIESVKNDPREPIPVVFNLSSWTNPSQSIADWLVEELKIKYQIPKKIGSKWIENNDSLLLLDGLDEVKIGIREACVEAINEFCKEYGADIAVCSRAQEYQALKCRLQLQAAILLQPLTSEQIERYISAGGQKLAALGASLKIDSTLQELAKSPLMLSIMSLAYEDLPVDKLLHEEKNLEKKRKNLFNAYVDRMFFRLGRSKANDYKRDETISLLSWLASKMEEHNQTVFLIEEIQPNWLPIQWQKIMYILFSRFIITNTISLTIFFLFAGLTSISTSFNLPGFRTEELPIELVTQDSFTVLLLFGIVPGLTIGIIDILKFLIIEKKSGLNKSGQIITVIDILIYVIPLVAILGWILLKLRSYPLLGVAFGLIIGVIFAIRSRKLGSGKDIHTVEAFSFSLKEAIKGGALWLIIGLVFGLILHLVYNSSIGIQEASIGISIVGLIFGVIGAAFGGIRGKIVDSKIYPNQGISLSTKNGVIIGISFGLFFTLLFGSLIFSKTPNLGQGFANGLLIGFSIGLLSFIWYGGWDVFQHYILRFLLWHDKKVTRNYTDFLDNCVDRIFLQKVGGGYIFIHRMLMEYFAELERESIDKGKGQDNLVS
jgi:hypothetical protein